MNDVKNVIPTTGDWSFSQIGVTTKITVLCIAKIQIYLFVATSEL